mmetsp:Transcript_34577/g.91239  ORF Transcript_34577/g.91239 Transcript_34577/m.91239 type:complete len:112 (-) Transcript_34577:467-802(-)
MPSQTLGKLNLWESGRPHCIEFWGGDLRSAVISLRRYYYMFKLISLAFSFLVFLLATSWTTPEIFNFLISFIFSLYCIWCIWSLHEALMLGGEAATKAGFTSEEVMALSPT